MTTTTTETILAQLKTFKQTREAEYDLTSLGIFGSFARGEARENSDVDIVYETNSPNLFKTVRMHQELERLLERRVDVIRLREHMKPGLKQRIMRDAKYV